MTEALYAMRMCESHGFKPEKILKNQFVITSGTGTSLPGLLPMRLDKLVLHHGYSLAPIPMSDEKGRLFGCFLGVGVDEDGALITAESFRRFNSKGRRFETEFESYADNIGGRYLIVLDASTKQRVYRDPMGQTGVFYNRESGLVGSMLGLVLDGDHVPDPMLTGPAAPIDNGGGAFPLGHSLDQSVRALLPNHRLDLKEFETVRIWPKTDGFPKPSKARMGKLIGQMVDRQRQILDALLPLGCDLALSGGAGSRALLACLDDSRRAQLGWTFSYDCHDSETDDALAAEHLCEGRDIPFRRVTLAEAKQIFGHTRPVKRQRMRRHWMRTSRMCVIPAEVRCNAIGLVDADCLELRGDGMGLLQSTWQRGQGPKQQKPKAGLKSEIAYMLGLDAPDEAATRVWSAEYKAWKATLPKSAQSVIHDFIALELHGPTRFAAYAGLPDRFRISPFGDRRMIGLCLQLPVSERFGGGAVEKLIEMADPDLAGEPYATDMDDMRASGLVGGGEGPIRSAS